MARPASSARRLSIWLPVAVLVLAGLGYGFVKWQEHQAASAVRTKLLADVDAVLAKPELDGGELSRLTALLHKQPDHASARDLLAAQARIELARGRPERATELFGSLSEQPGASAADQRLGAAMLLARAAAGAPDRATGNAWLEQALRLAESAHAADRRPEDALAMWLAAARLGRVDREKQAADELAAMHAESGANTFVRLYGKFDPKADGEGAVDAAAADLAPVPVEADAMRAAAQLTALEFERADRTIEGALGRGPGVTTVRFTAAVVFHTGVARSAAGSEARQKYVARRDAQVVWLLEQGNLDDARRAQVAGMRDLR